MDLELAKLKLHKLDYSDFGDSTISQIFRQWLVIDDIIAQKWGFKNKGACASSLGISEDFDFSKNMVSMPSTGILRSD